jgi:large subunit ribosomal protein L28
VNELMWPRGLVQPTLLSPVGLKCDQRVGSLENGGTPRRADAPPCILVVLPRKEPRNMAKQCEVCGKTPVVGRQVSHAHNVSARRFEPNLQKVRAMINGGVRRVRVCTRCLRSNKIVKAA